MEPDKRVPVYEKPSVASEGVTKGSLLSEGFESIEEAFAAADVEVEKAISTDVPEGMPPAGTDTEAVVEQAEETPIEQPEVAETTDEPKVDNELQALVDEIGEVGEDAEAEKPEADPVTEFLASEDFWKTEVEVDLGNGPESVSLREAIDGAMRQSDYTRKTQALAAEKESMSEATEFFRVFQEDPVAFAQALAVKANLINADTPVKPIDVAKFVSPEDAEAELDRRVEERFTSDPRFAEMQLTSQRLEMNGRFDDMESARGVTLSPELRQHLIDVAVRSGTTDLNQVLDAEMYRRQQARARAEETKRKAPSRPSSPGGSVDAPPKLEVVADIDEAFNRALETVGV